MLNQSSLAGYVTEQLGFLGPITNRSIFGAIGIFIEDRLLGIVADDGLYLHTGPVNRADYAARGCRQFKPYPNAFDLTTDHHAVPQDVIDDVAQLKIWGERALQATIEAARAKQLAGIQRARDVKRARRRRLHPGDDPSK